ncbi:hypothetical protein BDF22DRAFT_703819 [Syncephalis plumigaleata]|nr:hypothetical protein BDF22DRAFT_703819 [Syncephalis plumigaleata]
MIAGQLWSAALVLALATSASLSNAAAIRRSQNEHELLHHNQQHQHHSAMHRRATAENALLRTPCQACPMMLKTSRWHRVSSSGLGFDAIGNLLGYANANSRGHTDTSLKFADVIGHGGSSAILGFTQGSSEPKQPTFDAHQSAVGAGGNAIVNVLGVGDQSSNGHTDTKSNFVNGIGVAGGSSALGATQQIGIAPRIFPVSASRLNKRGESDYDGYDMQKTGLHRRNSGYETKKKRKVNIVLADDVFPAQDSNNPIPGALSLNALPDTTTTGASDTTTMPEDPNSNAPDASGVMPDDAVMPEDTVMPDANAMPEDPNSNVPDVNAIPEDTVMPDASNVMPEDNVIPDVNAMPEDPNNNSNLFDPNAMPEDPNNVMPTTDLNGEPFKRFSKLATPSNRNARVVTATSTSNAIDGLGGVLVLNGDGHGGGESTDGIENAIGLSNLLGAGLGTKLLGGESKSTTLHYDRRGLLNNLNVLSNNVEADDVVGAGTKLNALNTHVHSINGAPVSKEAVDQATTKSNVNSPKAGDEESSTTKTFSLLALDNNAGVLGDTIHTFQPSGETNAEANNLAGLIGDTNVLSHSMTQTKHRDGTVTRTMASRVANVNALTNVLGTADQKMNAMNVKQGSANDLAGVVAGAAVLPASISTTTLKDGSQVVEADQDLAQVDLLGNVAGKATQRVNRQRRGLLNQLGLFPNIDATKQSTNVATQQQQQQQELAKLNEFRPLSGSTTTTDVQSINGASLNTDFNFMGSSGVISNNGVDTVTGNTNELGLGGGIHALGSTTKTTTTTMPLQ